MTIELDPILVPSSETWRIAGASVSGGRSLAGTEQVVVGGGGYWTASLTIPIRRDEQVLAARALLAALDGRAGTLLVGPCDGRRANWPVDRYGRKLTPGFYRRRELDETPYEDPIGIPSAAISASLAEAAAIRATTCSIDVGYGSPLRAGQYFGVGQRLHVITGITATDGTVQTVTFRAPLRAAAAVDAPIELRKPVTSMRLASDDTGALDLSLSRFATLQLDLIEAI